MEEGALSGVYLVWEGLSPGQLILANLIILFAAAVQYALGIAFGLVAAPLLALVSLAFVPVPVLVLTFITALLSMRSELSLVDWRQVGVALSGRVAGSLAGAFVLSGITDDRSFMLVFGIIVALAVLLLLGGLKVPFNLASISIAGSVSGLAASLTGVGGPPMAIVYQGQKASDARPSLQVFFAAGAFLTILVLAASGHVVMSDFIHAGLLLPGLACGYLAGPFLRRHADRSFRLFMLATAAIASVLLIGRALL